MDFAAQQMDSSAGTLLPMIKGHSLAELRKSWKAFDEGKGSGEGNTVQFLILSRKPTPQVMWYWHASRIKAKFAYLCTSALSAGVIEELPSLFRLSPSDESKLSRSQPMVLVRRDTGDLLLTDLPADKHHLHELLKNQKFVIPKVSASNFYDVCFANNRKCLLFLQQHAPTQQQRQQILGSSFFSSRLPLGWVALREQAGFVSFFKDREGDKKTPPTALLLDTESHRYAVFSSSTSTEHELARWLEEPSFKDASQMPFLEPEHSSLSNSLAELFDLDFITPSLLLIAMCVFLGSLVLMVRL